MKIIYHDSTIGLVKFTSYKKLLRGVNIKFDTLVSTDLDSYTCIHIYVFIYMVCHEACNRLPLSAICFTYTRSFIGAISH